MRNSQMDPIHPIYLFLLQGRGWMDGLTPLLLLLLLLLFICAKPTAMCTLAMMVVIFAPTALPYHQLPLLLFLTTASNPPSASYFTL